MSDLIGQDAVETWASSLGKIRKARSMPCRPTEFSRRGLMVERRPGAAPLYFTWNGKAIGNSEQMTVKRAYDLMVERMDAPTVTREDRKADKIARERAAVTLNAVFDTWTASRSAKPSTAIYRSVWGSVVRPAGDVAMSDMTTGKYSALLRAAHARGCAPSAIHRAGTLLRQMVKRAALIHDIPPVVVGNVDEIFDGEDSAPVKSQKRQYVPKVEDVVALWHALPDTSAGHLLKVAIVTGCRKANVTTIHRDEIMSDAWVIPGEKMKQGKPHTVPLFQLFRDVLSAADGRDELLFGTDQNGTASNTRPIAASTLNALLRRHGLLSWNGEESTNATIHDFRRFLVVNAIRHAGIDEVTAQRMIAHTVNVNDVAACYATDDAHVDKTADGWKRWSNWLESVICRVG